ncbi:MAG: glutamate--tRNA ligase family protein [Planctomycetota bacterium]
MATDPAAQTPSEPAAARKNFLELEIEKDLAAGQGLGRFEARHPHALPPRAERLPAHRPRQAICIDFGMAQKYGGQCNLRFDDTNPVKGPKYVDAIMDVIHGSRFQWDALFYASDYFEARCTGWPRAARAEGPRLRRRPVGDRCARTAAR